MKNPTKKSKYFLYAPSTQKRKHAMNSSSIHFLTFEMYERKKVFGVKI